MVLATFGTKMADSLPPEIADLKPKLQRAFTLSWDVVLAVVTEAFLAGKQHGKAEASAEFKSRLSGLLELRDEGATYAAAALPAATAPPITPKPPKRAPRGTIKPTVIGILKDYGPPGLKPVEIAIRAAINENSVRGALNALSKRGVTRKEGDLWVLAKPI
jgi:hypothetical protein